MESKHVWESKLVNFKYNMPHKADTNIAKKKKKRQLWKIKYVSHGFQTISTSLKNEQHELGRKALRKQDEGLGHYDGL